VTAPYEATAPKLCVQSGCQSIAALRIECPDYTANFCAPHGSRFEQDMWLNRQPTRRVWSRTVEVGAPDAQDALARWELLSAAIERGDPARLDVLAGAGDTLAATLVAAEQRAKRAEPLEQAAIAYAALMSHGSDEQFRAAEHGLTAAAIDYAVASAGGPEVQSRG
jgi:hypothetical protein